MVQGAVLLTVGRSYVGNDVTHSTLLDRACACSYENLPKYRSYRVSNTAPWCVVVQLSCREVDPSPHVMCAAQGGGEESGYEEKMQQTMLKMNSEKCVEEEKQSPRLVRDGDGDGDRVRDLNTK